MHIEVLGEDGISAQARTYAEYRLFAALSQAVDSNRVTHACVILQWRSHPANDRVSCLVTVAMEGGAFRRVRASATHPYAAINRAIERLGKGWRLTPAGGSTAAHVAAE